MSAVQIVLLAVVAWAVVVALVLVVVHRVSHSRAVQDEQAVDMVVERMLEEAKRIAHQERPPRTPSPSRLPTQPGAPDREKIMSTKERTRRVFLKLPYLGAAGDVRHANVNIFHIESVREIGDNSHRHCDVYMTSGKVWQTPWTEEEVFKWMQEAYQCPDLIPDQVRVLELKKD